MAKLIVQHRRGTTSQWAENGNIVPKVGELVIELDEVNSLHKLKIGDGIHTYAELAYLQAGDEMITQVLSQVKPRIVTVELTENWEEISEGKYGQVIALDDITKYSRLDLQPNADMIAELKQLGVVFVTENNGGTITVYSVGNMPSKTYTMQATIVETECGEQDVPVVGTSVGTPMIAQSVNLNIENGVGTQSVQQVLDKTSFDIDKTNNPNKDEVLALAGTKVNKTTDGKLASGAFGNNSVVLNSKSQAAGKRSMAGGSGTLALGANAHTEGLETIALGNNTHAEGIGTSAIGDFAHSEGEQTMAVAVRSHAEGTHTIARGDASHVEGYHAETGELDENGTYVENSGRYAHAEGSETKAIGEASHAEGTQTLAKHQGGHAEGIQTTAYGTAAHTEGYNTNTGYIDPDTQEYIENSGNYAHAEGNGTYGIGEAAHAEGRETVAVGNYSHTQGYHTEAYGIGSTAMGSNTIVNGHYTLVRGKYNIPDGPGEDGYGYFADIVGNGLLVRDKEGNILNENRSNAYMLDWDGNGWFAGDVFTNIQCNEDGSIYKADKLVKEAELVVKNGSGHNSIQQNVGEEMDAVNSAEGELSIALGYGTTAKGVASVATGINTVANGMAGSVRGMYNVESPIMETEKLGELPVYIDIVGNGFGEDIYGDDGKLYRTARSNAYTLDFEGNGWFAGDVTIGENNTRLVTEYDLGNAANAFIATKTGISEVIIDDISPMASPIDITIGINDARDVEGHEKLFPYKSKYDFNILVTETEDGGFRVKGTIPSSEEGGYAVMIPLTMPALLSSGTYILSGMPETAGENYWLYIRQVSDKTKYCVKINGNEDVFAKSFTVTDDMSLNALECNLVIPAGSDTDMVFYPAYAQISPEILDEVSVTTNIDGYENVTASLNDLIKISTTSDKINTGDHKLRISVAKGDFIITVDYNQDLNPIINNIHTHINGIENNIYTKEESDEKFQTILNLENGAGGNSIQQKSSEGSAMITSANGANSISLGGGTTANGHCSFATGYGTIANGEATSVRGRFNIEDAIMDPDVLYSQYADIVGNGTGMDEWDEENNITKQNRSNAYTLDWYGNGWFAGTVECTGIIMKSPDGTRFKITVDNTGSLTATAM